MAFKQLKRQVINRKRGKNKLKMTENGEKKFLCTVRKHMRRILTQKDNEVLINVLNFKVYNLFRD